MHPALRDIQAQVSIDLVFSGPQADVQGFFDQQHRVLGGFIQNSDITPVYCVHPANHALPLLTSQAVLGGLQHGMTVGVILAM